jgi:hypothetical protein
MGMDAIEYVMTLEASLAVDVPDEVAQTWRTLGDVVAALVSTRPTNSRCSTQRAFHVLRAGLSARHATRHSLRSQRPVHDVPGSTWEAIAHEAQLVFPRRELSLLPRTGLGVAVLTATAAAATHGGCPAAVTVLSSAVVASHLDQTLGRHPLSLGALAVEVGWRNCARLDCWSESSVWNTVRRAAAEQSGWPVERCTRQTALSDLFPDG